MPLFKTTVLYKNSGCDICANVLSEVRVSRPRFIATKENDELTTHTHFQINLFTFFVRASTDNCTSFPSLIYDYHLIVFVTKCVRYKIK